MKNRIGIVIALLLLLAGGRLLAQSKDAPPADKAKDDEAELFPSMVLQIEDLSVEKIEAGLPAEEPLMAFERQTPLPGPGEIRIAEPAVDALLPDGNAPADGGRSFFTTVLFGAGLQNNLLGEITLYRLGLPPVIRLLFSHENSDGFAYRPTGLGYGERRDEFSGGIKLNDEWLAFEATGGFRDRERGLQERVGYYSASDQYSHLALSFSAKAPELFTFSAAARASITGFTLTGAAAPAWPVSYPPLEYLIGGEARFELAWPNARAGLALAYTYRNIPGNAAFELHRFRAGLDGTWDITESLTAEATVGVFTSTAVSALVPWKAQVRWFVFDWLSLTAGGGYRVLERNLADVRADFPFADFPSLLPDNYGWYGSAGTQMSFANLLLLTVDATVAENANYPGLGSTPDAATGLFPVLSGSEVPTLALDGRVKLPLWNWLTLSSLGRVALPFAAGPVPVATVGAEAAADEVTGAFGAKVSIQFRTDPLGQWEFPYLDATAYVRLVDRLKLSVEALDLLQPVLGGPRYSPYPYLAPGIRARFKIQISF
jgi:hypothetical protein